MLSSQFYFITHPNVVISRDVPVPRWPLSELGRKRMRAGLRQPWVRELTAICCSAEQKAIDGAAILAEHLGIEFEVVHELGENDRSATGFLPPDEFERVADQFFANPELSIRGWERAIDARRASWAQWSGSNPRGRSPSCPMVPWAPCSTAISPASRLSGAGQPPNGGDNYYRFTLSPREAHFWWRPFDQPEETTSVRPGR